MALIRFSFNTSPSLYSSLGESSRRRKIEVSNAFSKSALFFAESVEKKRTSYRKVSHNDSGFLTIEEEGLNPTRPKDLKEILDFIPATRDQMKKTCDIITPGFIDGICDLYDELKQINFRVLEVFGHALKLKDPMFFVKAHSRMGENDNHSILRTLYYPSSTDVVQKEGQIRCGEHSDYGGVTLLLQDETGGLEVKGLDGKFHPATPMPDSIVINIGDMLQRWTADQLVSTVHRVVVPKGTHTNNSRQSIGFFGHPNSNQDIVCIDGSNKYPPTNSDAYMESKYSKSFDKENQDQNGMP